MFTDHFNPVGIPGHARACPLAPQGCPLPIRANSLLSSPIWEISSSICISHTYWSIVGRFQSSGHPQACPGMPISPNWGCPLGLILLLAVRFEKFQVLFVYLIHTQVFTDHVNPMGIPGHARAYPGISTTLMGCPFGLTFSLAVQFDIELFIISIYR